MEKGSNIRLRSFQSALGSFKGPLSGQQMETFVEVALNPGITILDLAESLGFNQAPPPGSVSSSGGKWCPGLESNQHEVAPTRS